MTPTVGGDEIRRVLSGAHDVLERHRSRLDALAPILTRHETLAPASIARSGPFAPRPGLAVDMTVLARRPGERW